MKIPEQPGVYCLRALNSKIIYIGSTNNLQKRKNNHFSTMRYNKTDKGCKKMIDAYQAGDIVDFIIVELVNNYSEREQY